MAETMRRRLNSRCKGLIEAPAFSSEGAEAKVQYLHRTVRDFLARDDIWKYIVSGTHNSFDPDAALCGAFILNIKMMKCHLGMIDLFWSFVEDCIGNSLRLESRAEAIHVSVLAELDKAVSMLFQTHWLETFSSAMTAKNLCRPIKHWTATKGIKIGREEVVLTAGTEPITSSFFDFAFHNSLHTYIRYRLESGHSVDSLIDGRFSLLYETIMAENIELLKVLLQHGANPNLHENNSSTLTSWSCILWRWQEENSELSSIDLEKRAEIIRLILVAGADPRITVYKKSPESLIKGAVQVDQDLSRELLAKLSESRKAQRGKRFSLGLGTLLKGSRK